MTAMYPLSIVVHGVALNITVQSYRGQLCFGLIARRRALPDVNELADQMVARDGGAAGLAAAGARMRHPPWPGCHRADSTQADAGGEGHRRPRHASARAARRSRCSKTAGVTG